jgi:hypothetical protein
MNEYVAAIAPTLGAVAACVVAAASWRNSRKNSTTLQEIKVNVDGRLSTVLERVSQLTTALQIADVSVPPEPQAADKHLVQ